MTAPVTFSLTATSTPEATADDIARIRYAMSIVEPVFTNMVSDYELKAVVESTEERGAPTG